MFDFFKRLLGIKENHHEGYRQRTNKPYTLQKCAVCGKAVGGMNQHKCHYCNKVYCDEHWLPEDHSCSRVQPTSAEMRRGCTTVKAGNKI